MDDIGPSLKFATATVNKLHRSKGNGFDKPPADDPWATASPTRPAGTDPSNGNGFDGDEPPY